MERTTVYLGDSDREAIQQIREALGLPTDASVIRFALRTVASDLIRRERSAGVSSRRLAGRRAAEERATYR